ncbi:hypothetical protein LCGC14_1400650 [marine sediment metagenome]|uniref:Uncharacterized protein n=1 Tax=marine sediment metagenome TaxID=412755 RepID=A0A0F9JX73_9ZZZZ
MITAIYIKDGRTQLVLTPETEFEVSIVGQVDKGEHEVKIYTGSFYDCQAGYTRQKRQPFYDHSPPKDESLIIVMDIKPKEER